MDGLVESDLKRFPAEAPTKQSARAEKAKAAKLTKQQIEAMKEMHKMDPLPKAGKAAKKEVSEGAKRASMLRKIGNYVQHFPEKLKGLVPKRLSVKTPAAELEAILHSIETELGMSGGIEIVCNAFNEAGGVLEQITQRFNPLGLQLSGPISLDQTMRANREKWEPLAIELAIKYEHLFCMGIEARCLSFIATMVVTVHRANKASAQVYQAQSTGKGKEEASPELQAEADGFQFPSSGDQ